MISKRERGRPRGTGKDDTAALLAIAQKLVEDVERDYDEAAALIYLTHKPKGSHVRKTVIDRWRGRWKAHGANYLAQARAEKTRVMHRGTPVALPLSNFEALQQIHQSFPSEEIRRVFEASPFEKFKKSLKDVGTSIEELQERARTMTERMRDPLVQQALKQLQSPELQAAFADFRKYQS